MEGSDSNETQHNLVREQFEKIYGATPTVITYAPGRVELIGAHTDYNEGKVLAASIDRGVWVALRQVEQSIMTFYSDLFKSTLLHKYTFPFLCSPGYLFLLFGKRRCLENALRRCLVNQRTLIELKLECDSFLVEMVQESPAYIFHN